MEQWVEIVLKLLISMGASGIIGLEREITGHKAGIRTQILVGVGSTTFIMLAVYSDMEVSEQGRVIAGLATGLGFLGAGAIMKEGLNVKGLTTAAAIWVNASIGTAIGMGEYVIGLSALIIAVVVLSAFALLERVLKLKPDMGQLRIVAKVPEERIMKILQAIRRKNLTIMRAELSRDEDRTLIDLEVELYRRTSMLKLLEELRGIKGIETVSWEDYESRKPMEYLNSILANK
ncbi:MAG: MgtC/SapB family protein [Thermoplasmatota archaeon]